MSKEQNAEGLRKVPLGLLDPHPQNPRRIARPDVVDAIAHQLQVSGTFDPSHAILVRPSGDDRFQIISGHHRVAAARLAGLEEIPAWVRELGDHEALMQLVLSNEQGQLYPLERGLHALEATTPNGVTPNGLTLRAYAKQIGQKEDTVAHWAEAAEVAVGLETNWKNLLPYMTHLRFIHAALPEERADWVARLLEHEWSVEELREAMKQKKPKQQRKFITLTNWKTLTKGERDAALKVGGELKFNRQDTTSIEWARWSWNPVTGCEHNCPYCYARDIAERIYPQKFEPSLILESLNAPRLTLVPEEASEDLGHQNVFVCSMADLFGKWVPTEWIEAVLQQAADNPQWNFLLLTKFPIRMSEFEYPKNAWLGTTVDLQARVPNAERAMAKVQASIRWLSLEPLLEPIKMDWSIFQWVVIGGATRSTQTPDWHPPRSWLWDITFAAQSAGCAVYHKDNLANRLRDYPGAVEPELSKLPSQFRYLKTLT
jgi:ParB/RepB/Spo0J family partition protein